MNWKRVYLSGLAVVIGSAVLTGCGVSLFQQRGIEFTESTDPDILRIVRPDEGGSYERGSVLTIEWVSTLSPSEVDVELYKAGTYERSLVADLQSPTYDWLIPADLPASTQYQVVVKAFHPQQGSGELLLTAFSDVIVVVAPTAE